uniref:prolactin-like n=1 Tax=Jaculus jaculus TaxID=51337 RepID=UPI00064D4CF9|nr:prolactin-like [Jaculus jaculus]
MQLSLVYLCSRILLLMWVSNLLWKNLACQPACTMKNGKCHVTFQELIMRAATVSQYLSIQCSRLFNEFDKRYARDQRFSHKTLSSCHTTSLATPETMEQAQQLHPEVLLKLIVSILGSWTQPLQQVVTEIGHMQSAPDVLLSIARNIQKKGKRLLEGMKKILKKVPKKDKRKVKYAVWSGLASLQVTIEDCKHFAFYNLFHCLSNDVNKVDTYFKALKCQLVYPYYC